LASDSVLKWEGAASTLRGRALGKKKLNCDRREKKEIEEKYRRKLQGTRERERREERKRKRQRQGGREKINSDEKAMKKRRRRKKDQGKDK
jgi:hypothetical protein